MRRIDADKLGEVKFHSLPYTHITPSDVEAESYKRGWNDAIDSIIESAPTIEPERKKGKWNTYYHSDIDFSHSCNQCGYSAPYQMIGGKVFQKKWNFCPNCGADMMEEQNDQSKR